MFIASLFTIARKQKQPVCPSTDEWIVTMWFIYKMAFYPYLNKNKIIKLASKLMRLEKTIYIGSEEKVPYVLSDVVILILII